MTLKKLLLLCIPLAFVLTYLITGCIHGEHDDTPLGITTASLPPGQAGQAYTCSLMAEGGKYPYTWAIEGSGSNLPPGVYLSESGNITGTPTTDGSYSFTAKVTDSDNDPRMATKNFTIVVYPEEEVSITTAALDPAYVSEAYNGQMQAVGGTEPYTWTIVLGGTELVPGLYLSQSGAVTGTPTTPGISTVEVRVDDNAGDFDTRNITITVLEPQEDLAILTATYLPDRSLSNPGPYTAPGYALSAAGGVTPYTWSEDTGSAPIIDAGLALSSNGLLTASGTPSLGEHSFSVQLTDDAGTSVYKIFIVEVVP